MIVKIHDSDWVFGTWYARYKRKLFHVEKGVGLLSSDYIVITPGPHKGSSIHKDDCKVVQEGLFD